jgi:uncharacterized protein (DUF3084 family)
MPSGYVLIVALLILGGVLATLGDRIGTKVGKARLSLFNLRPRQTATLVTIITGCLISTLTLGAILAASAQLRTGIFELETIEAKLQTARREIEALNQEKTGISQALDQARQEQLQVRQNLEATYQTLTQVTARRDRLASRLRQTRQDLGVVQGALGEVLDQSQLLQTEIDQLQVERKQVLQQRDQVIQQRNQVQNDLGLLQTGINQLRAQLGDRDQQIQQREAQLINQDKIIKEREQRLSELEKQLSQRTERLESLERAALILEQDYQELRSGSVAIVRNQVLASGVIRVIDPNVAINAVEQLLRQANRRVEEITQNNANSGNQLIQITVAEVERVANQLKDGREYVISILSAGNYVAGESQILVFADILPNNLIYNPNTVVGSVQLDSARQSEEEIQRQLEQLLTLVEFRSRRSGLIGEIQIEDGRVTTLVRFIEQIRQLRQAVELRAITPEATYTSGPLKIRLLLLKDGQVLASN